ncbi:MAG: TatD family hydrolase [Proteobacteria bacterium]|nr:TatD family hydrolase [Pseudomonadota bacterium]MBU1715952.1 TatD family hydrolase [Pseudomonadota bacterium]
MVQPCWLVKGFCLRCSSININLRNLTRAGDRDTPSLRGKTNIWRDFVSGKKKEVVWPVLPPGISLTDTHCHLDMDDYQDDYRQVIDNAVKCGVQRIITIGIDLESSRKAIELAASDEHIYASVGVHPHNVSGLIVDHYDELRRLAASPKVVGFGEIGLDLVKSYAPVAEQKEHFKRQVTLAKELDLPLIVHDREAHVEVMEILAQAAPFPAGGVMHCFSGDPALAKQVMSLGFYLSVPGVVTFNKAETMQEVVRTVPLSSLLLETDGPYLAPVPRRGKRNEPALLLFTAARVAELKGVSLGEVASATTANACRLFGF